MRDIEAYTHVYEKDDFENRYQVPYRRKKILEIMSRYPHKKILEIGCGMEPIAKYLDNFESCTIVEPSEIFAKNARNVLDSNVEIVQDVFENSVECLRGKGFDFVLVSSLLHELEQPKEFLRDLSCVVSSETIVHVNVPNARSFHRLLALESGLIQDVHEKSDKNKMFQHHTVFDMNLLKEMLQNAIEKTGAKIDILDTGGIFVKPFTHRQMEMCLDHGILDDRILLGLYYMVKHMPELASEIYVNFCIRK